MGYAVEMYFDETTENKIKRYFKLLSDLGLSKTIYEMGTRPHISLAVYNEVDLNNLSEKLQEFLNDQKPIKLSFVSISIFPTEPSTVFLAPSLSEELLKIHRDYHDFTKEFLKAEWTYYLPNHWIPHCAIAVEISKQKAANIVDVILKDFSQFDFFIEKVGIVEFWPLKEMRTFSLKD